MKYTLKGYGLNTIIAKSLAITERDMGFVSIWQRYHVINIDRSSYLFNRNPHIWETIFLLKQAPNDDNIHDRNLFCVQNGAENDELYM